MLNEFSRTELLIGKKAVAKLSRSMVAVFGIGGVGTYAVEGLARAGVGRFMLVDDDCVCLTNINRQLHATSLTIGQPKVTVMRDRILAINPRAEVRTNQTFYMPEHAPTLILPDYDYIIDAIDTVTAKIDLILNAKAQGIPIISSMGAGNKLDPGGFAVADIYDTSVCPLAKVMRRELRKRGVDTLKVVYSREQPVKPKPEDTGEHGESGCPDCRFYAVCPKSVNAEGAVGAFCRQAPGSISFVPAAAGLLIAGEVVRDLINEL